MSIQFRFHPQKTVEAAAFLLKLHGKPMQYLGLLKMLYLSDRMALEEIEWPITGDRYVSMKHGPVLSEVYDLIKSNSLDNAFSLWSKFITTPDPDYCIKLIQDPGNNELCEAEENILRQVYQEFGHYDRFDLAKLTHHFPEWQNPGESSIPIAVEKILKVLGKSDREIEEIQQDAIREAYLDEVLNG
ncbi:MAG: Panacea domain-containing protein [Cyanobacteria bacterium P01_E01_bin.42]